MTSDHDATHTHPTDPTRTADFAPNPDTLTAPSTSTSTPDAPPGFVLEREIGFGGMGVVFLARQLGLNRPVALKLVKGGQAVDAKALIRFLAEAEAVAAVKHPNVVEVYQYGDHHGKPYLALEYCPGGELTTLVNREAKTSAPRDAAWFRRIADLMAKVAEGVNAAHALGIVHRDLKPANVFLTGDGTPKVADFGLAKRGIGSDLTKSDAIMGTPAYMAPEQAGGGTKFVGPEADVWALGVMLYELASGQRPIDTSGPLMDALARVAKGGVPQLRTTAPAIPPDLALIAHKCLSLDPHDRYSTAGGLANDLRNWLDGKPISARRAGAIEQAVKWAKRNKKLAGMGLAVFATMATATGVSLGFGLEANKQAEIAKEEKKNVEREVERTQRTLAKALLAPISASEFDSGLGVYEANTLWELVATRNSPVPLMVLDTATNSELTVAQFRNRAEFLDHAAIGLDSRMRQQANSLFADRLRDASRPLTSRRDLAIAMARTAQIQEADTLIQVLTAALAMTADGQELVVAKEARAVAKELAAVAVRLPPDHRAEVCDKAVELLTKSLVQVKHDYMRGVWAEGLAAVAEALPAERAEEVCGRATEELMAVWPHRPRSELGGVAEGLTAVAVRLPAERAVKVLVAALAKTTNCYDLRALAKGLAAVAVRLRAERAEEVCGRAAEELTAALSKAEYGHQRKELVEGVVALSARLPARRAVEGLTAALEKAMRCDESLMLAKGLAAEARRLPADKAAEVCDKAAARLLTSLEETTLDGDQACLAEGLAAVAERLPANHAAELCGKAFGVLTKTLEEGSDDVERMVLLVGLSALSARLPAERAAEVLTAALEKATDNIERMVLAKGLAAVVVRLPAKRAAEVSMKVAVELIVALERCSDSAVELAEGLANVASGLSHSSRAQWNHRIEFAAMIGIPLLHPDALPNPRPLPPQQLVELLKHPLVVKEARRAVLDALEFTYDRKFADLWDFVEFAEREHKELDLLTPPKRPTK